MVDRLIRGGITVLLIAAAMALFPTLASAQSLPPICDEYPELPVCSEDTGGDPDDDGDDTVDDDSAAGIPGSGGDGGQLPFTGYPLTPLLLLLLLLLLTGLAIRAWLAYRDRRLAAIQSDQPGPPLHT